jgi:PKD repeat protein
MPLRLPANAINGQVYDNGSGVRLVYNATTKSWDRDVFDLGGNRLPIAKAGGPYSALQGQAQLFSGAGSYDYDGYIVSYAWGFGDGTTGSGQSVSHTYSSPGLYSVVLTVTDNRGISNTDRTTITVSGANIAPTAAPGGPYSGKVGQSVAFDGTGSSDPDGSIVSYSWNFGDGSALASGATPSHTYTSIGNYTVTLTVTDNGGASSFATTTASITQVNQAPVANAGGPYSVTLGNAVNFDGSASADSDGTITTYDWVYGDGNSAPNAGATPSHTYVSPGNYTATLTVTDNEGATGASSASVDIQAAPVADAGGPYTATSGVPVSFDGSGSTDADGTITRYDWNAGDGTSLANAGPTPSHTYVTTTGSPFTVTLTVTDSDGLTDQDTTTTTVSGANQLPVADPGGPYITETGQTTTFDGTNSSDPDGTIAQYDWDFGDGNTAPNGGSAPTHTYADLGQYTVTLTVTDNDGGQDVATTTVDLVDSTNVITTENALSGAATRTDWETLITQDTGGDGLGFATAESVNVGETVNFKIHNPGADITSIGIYRAGHYGGDNARLVATISNTPTAQPNEAVIPDSQGATDCSGWSVTASWAVPSDAVSGCYMAVCKGGTKFHRIKFVVRDDFANADIICVMPTNTDAAYNAYGGPSVGWNLGKSVYGTGIASFDTTTGRAFCVSMDRPYVSRGNIINSEESYHLNAVDGLERLGYNVKYATDFDLDQRYSAFDHCGTVVFIGHNEYWSQNMVDNLVALRAAGKNLVVASGNTVFWRVRYDATNPRIMWCYKDSTAFSPLGYNPDSSPNALDPVTWTGTWSDSRQTALSADNSIPKRGSLYTGQFFRMNAVASPYKDIVVSGAANQASPLWRNTTVALGNDLTLDGAVGFEGDEIENPNDGRIFTKHGSSLVADIPYYDDDGLSAGTGSFEAGIAVSQTSSTHGVTVSLSSMNIMWLVSDYHSRGLAIRDDDFVQAFVNIMNDIGNVPATPDVGLTVGVAQPMSAYGIDFGANQPPVAVANGPYADNTGIPVQFSSAGSYDPEGGALTYNWNFGDGSAAATVANPTHTYSAQGNYTVTLTVTDPEAATGQDVTSAGITDNAYPIVNALGNVTPANPNSGDSSELTIGTEFFVDFKGLLRGVRFWLPDVGNPTHIRLYRDDLNSTGSGTGTGTLLAEKAVVSFTANGWTELNFDSPVVIAANTRYCAALHVASGGAYAFERPYFDAQIDNAPIHAYAVDLVGNQGQGTFFAGDGFPNAWGEGVFASTCYFVDAIFQRDDSANFPPIAEAGGPYSAALGGQIQFSSAGSSDPDGSIVTYAWDFGDGVGTSAEANPAYTYGTADAYTVTLTVTDNGGATGQDTASAVVTASGAVDQPFNSGQTPSNSDATDATDYELGMRFVPAAPIIITSVWTYEATSEPATSKTARVWTDAPGSAVVSSVSMGTPTNGQWVEYPLTTEVIRVASEPVIVSRPINSHFPLGPDLPTSVTGFSSITRAIGANRDDAPSTFATQANYHIDISYEPAPALVERASPVYPSSVNLTDGVEYQMGLRITPSATKQLDEIWAWNAAGNGTGTRNVKVWNAATPGTPILDTTMTAGVAGAWNRLVLGTPIALTSGSTYVITVQQPSHYGADGTLGAPGGYSLFESTFSTNMTDMPTNSSTSDYAIDLVVS